MYRRHENDLHHEKHHQLHDAAGGGRLRGRARVPDGRSDLRRLRRRGPSEAAPAMVHHSAGGPLLRLLGRIPLRRRAARGRHRVDLPWPDAGPAAPRLPRLPARDLEVADLPVHARCRRSCHREQLHCSRGRPASGGLPWPLADGGHLQRRRLRGKRLPRGGRAAFPGARGHVCGLLRPPEHALRRPRHELAPVQISACEAPPSRLLGRERRPVQHVPRSRPGGGDAQGEPREPPGGLRHGAAG
mmetsp:Transcript_92533/g.270875  ORF Transcript_92533/g.270875 Transcript_92533/m.270875 type:complete len:244 (-) Transcript_92533:317-1048(-)